MATTGKTYEKVVEEQLSFLLAELAVLGMGGTTGASIEAREILNRFGRELPNPLDFPKVQEELEKDRGRIKRLRRLVRKKNKKLRNLQVQLARREKEDLQPLEVV